MTDMMYEQEKSSKKKFLIPLIVLLLCGVAFTGAAYAYYSDVDASGNVKVDDVVYLNIYDSDACTTATGTVVADNATFVVVTSTTGGITTWQANTITYESVYICSKDNLSDENRAAAVAQITVRFTGFDDAAITAYTYNIVAKVKSGEGTVDKVIASNVANATVTPIKLADIQDATEVVVTLSLTKTQAANLSKDGEVKSFGFKLYFEVGAMPDGSFTEI